MTISGTDLLLSLPQEAQYLVAMGDTLVLTPAGELRGSYRSQDLARLMAAPGDRQVTPRDCGLN